MGPHYTANNGPRWRLGHYHNAANNCACNRVASSYYHITANNRHAWCVENYHNTPNNCVGWHTAAILLIKSICVG